MKRERLWPLLLPVASLAITTTVISLSLWFGTRGASCGILQLTGLYCPGCGGTRCAIALSHGNVSQAWGNNALLTAGVICFSLMSLYLITTVTLLGNRTPQMPNIKPRWIGIGFAVIILFTILRNTAKFSWLAP